MEVVYWSGASSERVGSSNSASDVVCCGTNGVGHCSAEGRSVRCERFKQGSEVTHRSSHEQAQQQ